MLCDAIKLKAKDIKVRSYRESRVMIWQTKNVQYKQKGLFSSEKKPFVNSGKHN